MVKSVHDFTQEYEFRADDGDYTPTDADRALIEDAIEGYLGELSGGFGPIQKAIEQYRLKDGYVPAYIAGWNGALAQVVRIIAAYQVPA